VNSLTLATPFIDPSQAHDTWYLLIVPMVIFVAIGYKAVRTKDMTGYWREVLVLVLQVLGGMAALAVVFMVVVNVLVPLLAPMPG
jgi:NAD/NADP transhydrogenase beta subunit|tara:strand:+ start:5495 stop:5749 length:255 start_codon:yes stop_codon:yes gene_type:complete